jgi:hypothetical protein
MIPSNTPDIQTILGQGDAPVQEQHFQRHMLNLLSTIIPTSGFSAVTPNDGVDLPIPARSLYIGGTGDVTIQNTAGTNVTFSAVPAGTTLLASTARVMATGTTATNIVQL